MLKPVLITPRRVSVLRPSHLAKAIFTLSGTLLFLFLGGCSGVTDVSMQGDVPEEAAPERPIGTKIGHIAPQFTLPRLGEEGEISLAELRGNVVVVTFWASWCGPCRREVPALEAAWRSLKDKDAVILGVSVDATAEDAAGFLKMFPVTYPMVLDAGGGKVGDPWGARSIPMTVVLDKRGVIRRKHLGYTPQQVEGVVQEVEELLREKG
jgi:peroxiredoxin